MTVVDIPSPRRAVSDAEPLSAMKLNDFLAADIPPREMLLSPWLLDASINMISAYRGIGKTLVAQSIGLALAAGSTFLKWKAPKRVPVLYLDGEMPASQMQQRAKLLQKAIAPADDCELFRIVSQDFNASMPDLSTAAGQARVNGILGDAKVIIVDNLSSLMRTGVENDAESWQPVAEWALRMRREKRAVIFIHHAGKNGGQRGTSKREDLLDCSIDLKRPSGYDAGSGCHFEWQFTKARGIHGEDGEPIIAQLETDENGWPSWTWQRSESNREDQIAELKTAGLSVRAIAEEVGIGKSSVERILLKQKGQQTQQKAYKNASRGK